MNNFEKTCLHVIAALVAFMCYGLALANYVNRNYEMFTFFWTVAPIASLGIVAISYRIANR